MLNAKAAKAILREPANRVSESTSAQNGIADGEVPNTSGESNPKGLHSQPSSATAEGVPKKISEDLIFEQILKEFTNS
jgi:hypothetical protein